MKIIAITILSFLSSTSGFAKNPNTTCTRAKVEIDPALYPVPDIQARVERSKAPNDIPWWNLWMSSYAIPTVYVGLRSGLFNALESRALSQQEVMTTLQLPFRPARILLGNLTALGYAEFHNGKFSLSPDGRRYFGRGSQSPDYKKWIETQYETPYTSQRLLEYLVSRSANVPRFPNEPSIAGNIRALEGKAWSFPTAIVFDKLGIFERIRGENVQGVTEKQIIQFLDEQGHRVVPERLREMLAAISGTGVLIFSDQRYRIAPEFREFLNPRGAFYKGGTFKLMDFGHSSPRQSWEALEKEKKIDESSGTKPETKMNATITSQQLAETYAFAAHMDAQGVGAETAFARSGLIRQGDVVLDVAGGAGTYSIAVALENPMVRVSIMELFPMTVLAEQWVEHHRLNSQIKVIEGDMFHRDSMLNIKTTVKPTVIFASNIAHDWSPATNLRLAARALETLPPGGRLILHEMPLAEDGISSAIATGFSETLRVWTNGMQYKLSEFRSTLTGVGFSKVEFVNSHGPFKFIVATK